MARKPIIAGNWKMNMTWAGAVKLTQRLCDICDGKYNDVQVVLCPPFTCIKGVGDVIEFDWTEFAVGAQDVCAQMPEGTAACTGDISVKMLVDLGCSYCIIGHSERRADRGETDAGVNAKAKLLLEHGITPIICCGESAECMEAGGTVEFISGQMRAALEGLTAEQVAKIVLAYEPIWAIGTGNVPTPERADANCGAVRQVVREMFGDETADAVRVLYGGSLKPENAELFLPMENIDGGLVGGAALDADKFAEIIRICNKLKGGIR